MALRSSRVALICLLVLIAAGVLGSAAEMAYRARTRTSIRYYRHRRLDRALVPDMDYAGVVHINHLGFRGPDFELRKEPGVTRVVVVGASTTFDPCATSDAETWAARLEHWLGELATNRKFQVVNAGVPGFPMEEQVIRLHTELHALSPDVIVVYAGHGIVSAADAVADTEKSVGTLDEVPAVAPWTRWLERNSRLYVALDARLRPSAPAAQLSDEQWASAVDRATESFRRDLTSFVLIARSFGAEVVLVEINRRTANRPPEQFTEAERAAWEGLFPTPPEVVYEGYQRFHDVWRDVADRAGASFIPADSVSIIGDSNYCPGDPIHFNRAGSEAMGRRLAEQMLAIPAIAN